MTRRTVAVVPLLPWRGRGLALLATLALAAAAAAAGTTEAPTGVARGLVFEDRNRNGLQDPGEPGLPGVLVSNGRDVSRTGADGRWTLPAGSEETFFVIQPAGWRVPVSDRRLPKFHYLHRELGSVPLEHPGIAPTGPLPERIDFPLLRQPAAATGAPARVLLIADPQPHSEVHVDWFRERFVDALSDRTDFSFGLVLGDVVRNDLSLFGPYVEANAGMPVPMFHVIGNHDLNLDAPDERRAAETYQRWFGPVNYAFFHGDSLFLVLNNIRAPLDDGSGRAYRGGFSDETLAFVRNLMRQVPADLRVVLATHIPLFPPAGEAEPAMVRERQALFEALGSQRELLALAGHTHTQQHFLIEDPALWPGRGTLHHWVVGAASGAWWGGEPDDRGLPDSMMRDGTPPGYGVLTLQDGDYRMDYRVAGDPGDPQLRIHAPRHMVTHERDVPLFVNVFNGTPRTRVEFRVLPDGGWRELVRVPGVDPHYQSRVLARDLSPVPLPGTRLPPPVPSHHLWYARIPRTLPPGVHGIEVRATDMWGREWRGRHVLEAHAPELPYSRILPQHLEEYGNAWPH